VTRGRVIPAEDWPPYRWLWATVVLARDPETGQPTPYTHGVRRHPKVWIPVCAVVLAWLVWSAGRSWWRSLLAFAAGILAGHFWW